MKSEGRQRIEPRNNIKVDLHVHSWCSDGLFSPQDVLEKVQSAGIDVACIADHETVGGYLEVVNKTPAGVQLVCGVEFSTYCDEVCEAREFEDQLLPCNINRDGISTSTLGKARHPREMHILGYFPDGVSDSLQAFLKELQQERVNRAKVTLVNLRKNGCKLSFDQLMEQVKGNCISRAHMARALIANGLVSSTYEAFNRYLDLARGIVPPPLISPKRVITTIINEGGVPVWAHPEIESFDAHIKRFVQWGLKGVEICSHRRNEAYSFYFERTAGVLDLYVTYGSDFHGFHEEELKGIEVPLSKITGFLSLFSEGAS